MCLVCANVQGDTAGFMFLEVDVLMDWWFMTELIAINEIAEVIS